MITPKTPQEAKWLGEHGKTYSAGWVLNPDQLDELWRQRVTGGVKRSTIIQEVLGDIDRDTMILEVGCNVGNQLVMLRSMGFTRLWGLELIPEAAEKARQRLGGRITQGSALDLPFEGNGKSGFDLVMTCWCLSHIAPGDVERAVSEIRRVARKWVFCTENYAPVEKCTIKDYLWQRDHKELFPCAKTSADIGANLRNSGVPILRKHYVYPSAKPHPAAPSHAKGHTDSFLLELQHD